MATIPCKMKYTDGSIVKSSFIKERIAKKKNSHRGKQTKKLEIIVIESSQHSKKFSEEYQINSIIFFFFNFC